VRSIARVKRRCRSLEFFDAIRCVELGLVGVDLGGGDEPFRADDRVGCTIPSLRRLRCWRLVRSSAVPSPVPPSEVARAGLGRLRLGLPPIRARAAARAPRRVEGARDRGAARELAILRRQARRPQLTSRDRLVLTTLSRVLPRRSWHAFLVTPETLPRWHRCLIARRWTYPHRRPGRPPLDPQVRELILRLGRENSDWGYVRIVGELRKLGINVSATLVRNVLARAGIPPARSVVSSPGVRSCGSTPRRCSRATSSRSRRSGCGGCTCSSSSRSGRAGSSTSPVRAIRTRCGWPSKRATWSWTSTTAPSTHGS
jgi:hypothetical protein